MRRLVVVVAAVAAVVAGCSAPPAPPQQFHASRTVEYRSLQEAAREAEVVVEIAVEKEGAAETVGAVPFTVTSARVTDVLRGSFEGSEISLRQVALASEGELLGAGERYVALLVPFTYEDYKPTGQHVVVGGWQGLYRVEGDELVATDKVRTALPRRLKRASFVAALAEP